MRRMLALLLFVFLSIVSVFAAASATPCAAEAKQQAKKLLEFHFGEGYNSEKGEGIQVYDSDKKLPSIRNPENPKQKFKVFEFWGYVYKGKYRTRLIYFELSDSTCVLMGQEVLEFAKL